MAQRLKTSQQQVSRLESPAYEGHSLSTLRRVAETLGARVKVVFEYPAHAQTLSTLREPAATYKTSRPKARRHG